MSSVKTNRSVGRPRKSWEDEISEFLRHEESEESTGNDLKNNDSWIGQAKKQKERKKKREGIGKRK